MRIVVWPTLAIRRPISVVVVFVNSCWLIGSCKRFERVRPQKPGGGQNLLQLETGWRSCAREGTQTTQPVCLLHSHTLVGPSQPQHTLRPTHCGRQTHTRAEPLRLQSIYTHTTTAANNAIVGLTHAAAARAHHVCTNGTISCYQVKQPSRTIHQQPALTLLPTTPLCLSVKAAEQAAGDTLRQAVLHPTTSRTWTPYTQAKPSQQHSA